MKKYKVAVITRTKDRKILVQRAIKSVLGQTFGNWIMVIVNDGGNKEEINELAAKYGDKFGDRLLIVHNKKSLGMEAASNIGIKSSDSEYVVIHDDDDSWHPLFLQKCVQFLDSNPYPSVAGVITYTIRVIERLENGKLITEREEPFNLWLKSVNIFRMASNNVFPPISFLFKREVFDKIGYYRDDLPVLGDWEFNLRYISKYDIFLIPEKLAYYHHRLETKEGIYSNSVVKDDNKHKFYDALLRNELLRQDLEKNVIGMGYLVNISKSFEDIHSQIYPIERFFNRLRSINWFRKLIKNLILKSPK